MLKRDPDWYCQAVFYEVSVRGFYDSNGDGIGDLPGMLEKLDYLHWLGVDCLWLLPIFCSPGRDGGYDVSDFYNIQPEYGTVEDLVRLIEAAHHRGMRIIADLVLNHTSDQHPWFQESRRSKDSPYRQWYVWSDAPERYKDARIIFTDTETSNWAFDPQTGQYYFHRFFSHQPDLNYDHPDTQEAMLRVAHFWLERGLDGFRLDAVPYLFEREGTTCENLPETHAFLKRLRAEIDQHYPDCILLAEANQWPAELMPYFGEADECHACFHFPLMPRLFLAVLQEDRASVIDILKQTPPLLPHCQWQLFLRNHDELTLEMVSEEERQVMYAAYAPEPRMKQNVGIRRRLAPLLENDRRRLELFHALLLSLPGSPMLYYGDEIGMGDNISLPDRDGVRTPMQWSNERNGGFSQADFERIYLPPILNPVYGKQAVNVEAQMRSPHSLLCWVKHLLAIRKHYAPIFGTGEFEPVQDANRAILAYTRTLGEQVMLCVNNLSHLAQPVTLDLSAFRGRIPVELSGKVTFSTVGEAPSVLTLPPYGFFWFELVQ